MGHVSMWSLKAFWGRVNNAPLQHDPDLNPWDLGTLPSIIEKNFTLGKR